MLTATAPDTTPSVPRLKLRRDLIKPLPSQAKLLESMYTHEYLLFGGAAGPGKSYILRWALVELLMSWFVTKQLTGVRVGLFCEDYPSLKDRQITRIKREFPVWLGELSNSMSEGLSFVLRPEYGGGILTLRNLDDPAKYASSEFAAIAVDELTKNERQTFDDLRFRKRWPGIEHSPFLAASNPGSRGHAWVKKLWIDRDFSGDDNQLDADKFLFIPAKAGENPHLPQSYWDTLNSLPPTMRKAMLEGNWDIFAGQFFADWNRGIHVVRPFMIPETWRRVIGIDYGFERPSAVVWCALDPSGGWWVYRELYKAHLTYTQLAYHLLEMTPPHETFDFAAADPAIWGDRPRHEEAPGQSGGEILDAALRGRGIYLQRGNHNRVPGWMRIRQLLQVYPRREGGGHDSRFHAFETCPQLIRTIPTLVHDDIHVEDLDTDGDDHLLDALRYAVNATAEAEPARMVGNFDHIARW